jgi:hypothetical protein
MAKYIVLLAMTNARACHDFEPWHAYFDAAFPQLLNIF